MRIVKFISIPIVIILGVFSCTNELSPESSSPSRQQSVTSIPTADTVTTDEQNQPGDEEQLDQLVQEESNDVENNYEIDIVSNDNEGVVNQEDSYNGQDENNSGPNNNGNKDKDKDKDNNGNHYGWYKDNNNKH
jgi:hypothetical protein